MTSWYRTGTVSVENASTTVTGSLTAWLMAAKAGDAFVGPDAARYEITAVTSNTEIEIYPAYAGSTASGQSYAIERISTAWNSVSELSVTIAETAEAFQRGFAMRSTSSVEIGAGEHEFSVPPGLPILPGATLKIASALPGEAVTHWIGGVVTEYEGQSLQVLAQSWEGEGDTRASWNINVAGIMSPLSTAQAISARIGTTAGKIVALDGTGKLPALNASQLTNLPAPGIADVTGLSDALAAKLNASAYTAADVLAKLLTVDGANSGLDADRWRGAAFTISTAPPSGGADGDFWFEREA